MTKLRVAAFAGLSLCAAMGVAQRYTNVGVLLQLSEEARITAEAEKREATLMARLLGWPVKAKLPNGREIEIAAVRNGRPFYWITDNADAAISSRANKVYPGGGAGLSLTGTGVILGEWDGGNVRDTHDELVGQVTNYDGSGLSDHATHVAGTLAATGVWSLAKGMAYGATVAARDWNSDTSEMTSAAAGGLRLSNHSYGYITGWYWNGAQWEWWGDTNIDPVEAPGFGIYDPTAAAWDNLAYNAPYYLIVKSAGNDRNEGPPSQPVSHLAWNGSTLVASTDVRNLDGNGTGYDTVSWSSTAKNILTVGAVNDVPSYTGAGSVSMSTFSCWGPTDDGRIKPDIVGNGVNLLSSVAAADNLYSYYSGTSMSGPSVTGSLGLLVQHHRNLNAGVDMRSATLKALAIHTADETGAAAGPDYQYGWGLIDTEAAAAVITLDKTNNQTITENVLNTAGTYTKTILSNGTSPIRVTIAWTDPAGTPPSWSLDPTTPMLVNDLDLRVSNGTTFYPWVLDPSNPSAAATTGDNFRDNVEQVLIPTPTPGLYTITVTHKGASLLPSNSQAFSMIISGNDMTPNNSGYVSQSVPLFVLPGQTFSASITMKNTGASHWNEVDKFRMNSVNPQGNTIWGYSRILISGGAEVANDANYTFTRNFVAPATPGVYNFRWRMVKEGVALFGAATPNVQITVAQPLNSKFLAYQAGDVPDAVSPGEVFTAKVRFQNTGSTTWSAAGNIKLNSMNPQGNTTWGYNRMLIAGATTVPMGSSYIFQRSFTAPATLGSYNFQWRTVQDGVSLFGATSTNKVIVVVDPLNSQYVSQSVPTSVQAGSSFNASITMKNKGDTVWTAAGGIKMNSVNPQGNTTWGANRIVMGGAASVAYNQDYTFTRSFTAPLVPGVYNFKWRTVKEGVALFGDSSPNVAITVTP